MIDTDKYIGHSPQHEWMLRGSGEPELCRFADGDVMLSSYWLSCPATKANQKLIADAPLLLAEVERLREVLKSITDDIIPPQHEGQTQVELTYKLIELFMKEAKEND